MPEVRSLSVWFWFPNPPTSEHPGGYRPLGFVAFAPADYRPTLDEPPRVIVRTGGLSGSSETRERCAADLDDAIVLMDEAQASGRLSHATPGGDAMIVYFGQVVRNAQAVVDAIRSGSPMPDRATVRRRP